MREEVGRLALARLPERGAVEVHRDVAVRIAGGPLDDWQVDVEGGDPDPRGDAVGGGCRLDGGGADPKGGRVISGISVATAADGASVGAADGPGSAVTGVVYVKSPPQGASHRGR